MTTLMTLMVGLGLDAGDFSRGLRDAENDANGFGSRVVDGMSSVGGAIVASLAAGAVAGGLAIGGYLGGAIEAAGEAQDAQTQLNAVIESTHGVAGVTADSVNQMASELGLLTRFEDDAIVAGENMLLTFTNVGADVFPTATETMLDMSQALGQNLKTSAMQLGKALNDPVNGITALRKIGVTFADDQVAMAQAMMEVGDIAGAQMMILGELQREFGGSARAAGETFGGQLQVLKNQLGNVQETVGTALLPTLTDLAYMLNDWLARPETQAWIEAIAAALAGFAQQAMAYLPVMVQWLQDAFGWLEDHQAIVVGVLSALGPAVAVFVYTTVLPAIGAFLAAAAPVLVAMAAIGAAGYVLYRAWTENWGGIRDAVLEVWNSYLLPAFNALVDWGRDRLPDAIAWLAQAWENWLLPALVDVFGWIGENVMPVVMDLFGWLQVNLPAAVAWLADAWQNRLLPALMDVFGWIGENVMPVFAVIYEWLYENIPRAVEFLSREFDERLQPAMAALSEFFSYDFGPFLDAMLDVLDALGVNTDDLRASLDGLGPTLGALWDFIEPLIEPMVMLIPNGLRAITGILDALTPMLHDLADTIRELRENGLPDWMQNAGGGGIQQAYEYLVQPASGGDTYHYTYDLTSNQAADELSLIDQLKRLQLLLEGGG